MKLIDTAHTAQGLSGRDQRAVFKTASGLMKLLYPDGRVMDAELEELLLRACEHRQRVREQLHMIAPGEYDRVRLGVRMMASGREVAPNLPDADRIVRIALPERPAVGEVLGLAVTDDHGAILKFEMQATKGHGRIIPLGSIQRVMKESIDAAAQYIRAHHADIGISADWYENYDVAVLAVFMSVPKEGPSAGIAILTGIVSALTGVSVRHDLAMTGELTIMGRVLPVGGIQQKIRAAFEAGVREVLLPAENMMDTNLLPAYIREGITLTPVEEARQVLSRALLPAGAAPE